MIPTKNVANTDDTLLESYCTLNNALIFILYAPIDYEWSYQLAEQLKLAGLNVYIEPLEIPEGQESTHRRKTTKALYDADVMLPVISQESAVGDSATVFEDWWRPFLEEDRPVIACIVPDAPSGAEHWMPFDLFRRKHVDFRTPKAYNTLCELLGVPQEQEPPALLLASNDNPIEESPQPIATIPSSVNDDTISSLAEDPVEKISHDRDPKTLPVAPPSPQVLPFSIDEEASLHSRSLLSLVKTTLSGLIGFAAVLFIWQASLQTTDSQNQSAETWLLGLSGAVACLFIVGRIMVSRRERQQALDKRRKIAKKWGMLADHSQRPPIYIEVIESPFKDEINQIWAMSDESMIIGYGRTADVPLQSRKLDRKHCLIFYDPLDGYYYLENTCERLITYHDRVLDYGEVIRLVNGDLIALETSVILQFRTQ